jgi:hypothetical protein
MRPHNFYNQHTARPAGNWRSARQRVIPGALTVGYDEHRQAADSKMSDGVIPSPDLAPPASSRCNVPPRIGGHFGNLVSREVDAGDSLTSAVERFPSEPLTCPIHAPASLMVSAGRGFAGPKSKLSADPLSLGGISFRDGTASSSPTTAVRSRSRRPTTRESDGNEFWRRGARPLHRWLSR